MTLIEQIQAQKALMESKGAIGLRLEMGRDAIVQIRALPQYDRPSPDEPYPQLPSQFEGMRWELKQGMEGFTILATWPETDGR